MEVYGSILLIATILGIGFGDWQDWFKREYEKEYEEKEMGWIWKKIGAILSWGGLLFFLLVAFTVLKFLWRMA